MPLQKLLAKGSKSLWNSKDIFMLAKEKESSERPFWVFFKD